MAALYEKAEAARGPFDIVVANAGMAGSAPAAPDDARRLAAHARRQPDRRIPDREAGAGRHGAARTSGRIVFVASTAGLKGYAYVAPYVAAKHGVVGLMRALAAETARTGVTVNAVCPGFVETDMLEESVRRIVEKTGRSAEEARASLAWRTTRRAASSSREEVAAAVLWLCSEDAGVDHRPGDFRLGRRDMVSAPLSAPGISTDSKERLRLWIRLLRASRTIEAELRERLQARSSTRRCRAST